MSQCRSPASRSYPFFLHPKSEFKCLERMFHPNEKFQAEESLCFFLFVCLQKKKKMLIPLNKIKIQECSILRILKLIFIQCSAINYRLLVNNKSKDKMQVLKGILVPLFPFMILQFRKGYISFQLCV